LKIHYDPKLKPLARKLRKEGTLAEVLLWDQLKGRKMKGYKFTRQKPVGNYIVDFFCNRLRLVIEIDGITHEDSEKADRVRQNNIEKIDFKFLCFYDSEVREHLFDVLEVIEGWVEKVEKEEGVIP
jgi:very-short-patch-repair endonuclease